MTIPEKIKYYRIKNNMTLEELGNAVGVGKSTVRKWETGQIANMKIDKIEKLAAALKINPIKLMGWKNNPQEELIDEQIISLIASLNDEQKQTILNIAKQFGKTSN